MTRESIRLTRQNSSQSSRHSPLGKDRSKRGRLGYLDGRRLIQYSRRVEESLAEAGKQGRWVAKRVRDDGGWQTLKNATYPIGRNIDGEMETETLQRTRLWHEMKTERLDIGVREVHREAWVWVCVDIGELAGEASSEASRGVHSARRRRGRQRAGAR